MATNYVVSSHAGATQVHTITGARGVKLVKIPDGVTVHFFCQEKHPLSVTNGWKAYNYLMANPPKIQQLANVPGYNVFKGKAIPNYIISGDETWVDSNGLSASGLFIAGDTDHTNSNTSYLGNNDRLSAAEYFGNWSWSAGDQVFWLACRVW